MLKSSFNQINFIKKSMDASWLRNSAIADNIANVDTPNYKKKVVNFENELKMMMDINNGVGMTVTHEKHIPLMDLKNFKPRIEEELSTNFRADKNNVDIDVEMAELARNQVWYRTMTQQIKSQMKRLSDAIKSGS